MDIVDRNNSLLLRMPECFAICKADDMWRPQQRTAAVASHAVHDKRVLHKAEHKSVSPTFALWWDSHLSRNFIVGFPDFHLLPSVSRCDSSNSGLPSIPV